MIRYDTDLAQLTTKVTALKKTWMADAAKRTATFKAAGKYTETKGNWSAIKDVFVTLQHTKCAFCERALESKKEKDIEHYRPKSGLKEWPVPKDIAAEGFQFTKVPAGGAGYHLLPYHLQNYAIACARCNSDLKSNMFPIEGTYQPAGDDPVKLNKKEKPYLLFPIGRLDSDPEDLIAFHGIVPQPKMKKGSNGYRRARVTIAFFKLADPVQRKELFRGRAEAIVKIGTTYRLLLTPGIAANIKDDCERILAIEDSPVQQHAACRRAYLKLWKAKASRRTAEKLLTDAIDFLAKMSGGKPDPR